MKSFQDKVAAITGAGSGIGRALSLELARRGCHLALSDIDEQGLAATAERIGPGGVRVTTQTLDTSDREAVENWARQVVADHGRVNLIFNNAGVALSSTVEGVEYDDFHWIMNINFWGVVHGTKAFLPHLKASGEGHVINLSSVFGLSAQPTMGMYNASKFAVRGLTESLRQELDMAGTGVSATCVHPGGIKTNIAKNSRTSKSIRTLVDQDEEEAKKNFEKLFITTPDKAARVILKGVEKNKRRVLIGPDARVFDWMVRLFPTFYQRIMVAGMKSSLR